MPHPERVLAALTNIAETAPELLRAPERWAMPRDMSGFSALEAEMLAAINAAGLPKPEWEYPFDWCCLHEKREHHDPMPVPHPGGGTRITPGCSACQQSCRESGHLCLIGNALDCWAHEYRRGRKWRFDFAWPAVKVAVECEGGTHSGGRHTRGPGFEKDAEKYNAALLAGWRVLRFTQRQITSGEALVLIERMLA